MAGPRSDLAVVVRAGTEQLASDLARGSSMLRAWARQVEQESPRATFGGQAATASLRALTAAGQRVSNTFRGATQSLATFTSRTVSSAAGLAMYETGVLSLSGAFQTLKESVNLAADLEQTTTAFEVMLGSADRATKLVNDLRTYAKETPFRFGETADAARQLMAYGFAADQVIPALRTLGDISSGLGGKMPLGDAAYLAGTLKTQGRAYTKDIWQFTNRGVELLPNLAKHFGVLEEEMRGLIEEGRVGFVEVWRALEALRGPGGRFENMMGRQAKTMRGLFEIAADSWEIAKTAFGQVVIEEVGLKDAARDFESFAKRVEAAITGPGFRGAVRFFGDLSTAAVQTAYEIGRFASRWVEMRGGLRLPDINSKDWGVSIARGIILPLADVADGLESIGVEFKRDLEDYFLAPLRAVRDAAREVRDFAVPAWKETDHRAFDAAGLTIFDNLVADRAAREKMMGDPAGGYRELRETAFPAVRGAIGYRDDQGRSLFDPMREGETGDQFAERYRKLDLAIGMTERLVATGHRHAQPILQELLSARLRNFLAPFSADPAADLPRLHDQFWRGQTPPTLPGYRAGAPVSPVAPPPTNRERWEGIFRSMEAEDAAKAQGDGFFASLAPRIVEEFGQRMGSMAGALSAVTGVAATATLARPSNELQFPDRPDSSTIELANRLRGEYDPLPALNLFKRRLDDAVRHGILPQGMADRGYRDEVRSVAERLGIGGDSRLVAGATVGSAEDAKLLANFRAGAASGHEANVEELLRQIRDRLTGIKGNTKAIEQAPMPRAVEVMP